MLRNNGGYLYAQRVHGRLGPGLRALREAAGLSRYALEQLSGVSRDEIGDIEEGRVRPSHFILCQLAAGLGLTIGELHERLDE